MLCRTWYTDADADVWCATDGVVNNVVVVSDGVTVEVTRPACAPGAVVRLCGTFSDWQPLVVDGSGLSLRLPPGWNRRLLGRHACASRYT